MSPPPSQTAQQALFPADNTPMPFRYSRHPIISAFALAAAWTLIPGLGGALPGPEEKCPSPGPASPVPRSLTPESWWAAPADASGIPRPTGVVARAVSAPRPDPVSAASGGACGPLPLLSDSRALWVVRDALISPAGIRRMVEDARRAGFTDLFVQVRGRGDAYYRSALVSPPFRLTEAFERHGDFDPLQMVIDLARRYGLRVHAWINVYLVRGGGRVAPGHVVNAHPDWMSVDRNGTSMDRMSSERLRRARVVGVFLEPGNHEVVAHLTDVVRELVRTYELDGIHLDYIRYPEMEVGYGEAMRASFRRRTGVDPLDLSTNGEALRSRFSDPHILELRRAWVQFKADQVTALVRKLRKTTREGRRAVYLSAAVKPDPVRALEGFGQDWVRWVNEGLIDMAVPMMYSPSSATVRSQAALMTALVPAERVWAGIAVYNQPLEEAAEKIAHFRGSGVGGISVFSYNSIPGGGKNLLRLPVR